MSLKSKGILFNDRDGHTVLSAKERKGLLLDHISNMRELDQAEQLNLAQGLVWLQTQKGKDFLTETFFRKLHKKLFGQVWKWAGAYRVSDKNIGIEYWRIPSEMHKFLNDVKFWISNHSFKTWPEFLAHFHHRLVYIHPFPNGNGRFSRIITQYLCWRFEKPSPLWWVELSPKERRSKYIEALQQADQKNYKPLTLFFKGSLSGDRL